MTTCSVVQQDDDAMLVSGGNGAFFVVMPKKPDWSFQCDDDHFFWAMSESAGLQVSVNPYKPSPDEDLTPATYLGRIGERVKRGMAEHGVRLTASAIQSFSTLINGEVTVLETTIDAPVGQTSRWFPQDSSWTTRQGPNGWMLDLHVTAYYRDAADQERQRKISRAMLATFAPAGSLKTANRAAFPGLAPRAISNEAILALVSSLDCHAEATKPYCAALERFVVAKPMARSTNRVWAGRVLVVAAGNDGTAVPLREGVHFLRVQGGKATFNGIKPSDDSEAKELRAVLADLRAGKAPSRASGLMKYLSGSHDRQANPVEMQDDALSFLMAIETAPGVIDERVEPSRVFVREDARTIVAIEVWSGGHQVSVAEFPKD